MAEPDFSRDIVGYGLTFPMRTADTNN